eukprot:TRINITY_DN11350_c0_g1::TRINITY_DN11350_c0_g1_i1::g.26398::m.26398 TRINITY_DN11350_c0_g1::TRINITY_DN11350_c0_g1_i1::g.26398  ORF type:complete len:422 (+),score=21.68,sp/Q6PBU5/GRT1A_DANRE/28.98/4e-40,RabGAP-TBC/PF00566.13/4.2e-33 TRINITY_DN11350_c0_g1_i1:177-1268(+)
MSVESTSDIHNDSILGIHYSEVNNKRFDEIVQNYKATLDKKLKRWDEVVKLSRNPISRSPKFKAFARSGIPKQYRTQAWLAFSGMDVEMKKHPGLYQKSLKESEGLENDVMRNIDACLLNTFPDHPLFYKENGDHAEGMHKLRNVLRAYAVYNKSVGFCNGMNHVAGFLILATSQHEENTFFLLHYLVKSLGFYSLNMIIMSREIGGVLNRLMEEKLARVWGHFTRTNVPLQQAVADWYLGLYVTFLPAHIVLRIWDCLFFDGSCKILHRVAVSLFKFGEKNLLKTHTPNEFNVAIKNLRFYELDADQFIKLCFSWSHVGSIKASDIVNYRQDYLKALIRSRPSLAMGVDSNILDTLNEYLNS